MPNNDIGRQLYADVMKELPSNRELTRGVKRKSEKVRDDVKATALRDMNEGYATGEFVASVKEKARKPHGGLPARRVYSDDPKANLLEYGTEDTPEYGTFAKVAFRHGGTPDGHE